MPTAAEICDHADRLLAITAFRDYGPNGLQVPGSGEVQTLVTGVSAHVELFEAAAALRADLVLVHHGLFWRSQPLQLTPVLHRRLGLLLRHDMALGAYHLPLDAHPEHGNNALIGAGLGGVEPTAFAPVDGADVGVHVRFAEPGLALDELAERVAALVGGRRPLVIAAGDRTVRRLGIVSGAGTDFLDDAAALGLDAFLTGEPSERAYGLARDLGTHFLAAGHHATETFGIRRLGELLARDFGLDHTFVDVANPI